MSGVFGRLRDRPRVYGHRGTRSGDQKPGPPENTLAAMRHALEQGADGIELDVRLCGSGEVIVLHDVDLMRMAGHSLRAQDATLSQLQAHDLGGRGHLTREDPRGQQDERVPLLDEAMDLVLEHGSRAALLNVEIKPDVPDAHALVTAVVARIAARSAEQRARVIVSSFSAPICEAVLAVMSDLAVAFLFERMEHAKALPKGSCAVHPHHALLDGARVAQLRGLLEEQSSAAIVNTWTVNDPQRARELAAAGVDGIITDDVPMILAALAS